MTTQVIQSDARADLSKAAGDLNLLEFWDERADIELQRPRALAQPYRWRWVDIEPRLREAATIVPLEEAERRALVFKNPGLTRPAITHTIFAAYSLYNPGEVAPVHRHTPSASRFALEGDGGYTVVAGEKITMKRGDLILTPNGCWHDHGNEGTVPVIWVDVLDVPLVESLNATIFEFDYVETAPSVRESSNSQDDSSRLNQIVTMPPDHSRNLYGIGGVKPLFVDHKRGANQHSPQFFYRWSDTREALERMRDYSGSPYDGIVVEYIDPVSGGSVMPSMSYRAHLLRPNEATQTHRRMASTVYCVLDGEGYTEVDGQVIEWRRNDVFVIPNWVWHRHVNTTSQDVFLYAVTDEPTMRKLSLYRHEAKQQDGSAVALPS